MIIRINSRCIVFGVVAILILFNVYLWHVPVKTRNDELILSSLNDTLLVVNKELVAIHNKLLEKKAIVSTSAIAKPPPVDSIDKPEQRSIRQKKRAVLFTMDSIESYEQNSLSGGAAGELIIRHSLEFAFEHFGVKLTVIRSDAEFNKVNMKEYDTIILDPWTWAAKGWVPKRMLVGHEHKIYILDFFGAPALRGNSLKIDPKRILTAYGSQWNSFLGYYIKPSDIEGSGAIVEEKTDGGVIWGKDAKHFEGREGMLRAVAQLAPLSSTATQQVFQHPNVKWLGHQTTASWKALLRRSKFMIGLGNPLLGPSAIDAISNGCMFINPIYRTPMRDGAFKSQHPYAAEQIGEPYVCSFHEENKEALVNCVKKAQQTSLTPFIPKDFTEEAYLARVEKLFGL